MKVWPKNDDVRKILKHPNGVGFREHGPIDWPDDSFTHRRIRDGDVLTEDPTPQSKPKRPAPPTSSGLE